jgi:hypothetical protein
MAWLHTHRTLSIRSLETLRYMWSVRLQRGVSVFGLYVRFGVDCYGYLWIQ